MASITFRLQISEKTPKGKAVPIYIRLQDTKKVDFETKTNFSILPTEWNAESQRPKNLKTDYFKNLDTDLQDLKTSLLKKYNNSGGEIVNTAWLKEFINPKQNAGEVKDDDSASVYLLDNIKSYIEFKKTLLKEGTIKKLNVLKNKVIKYEAEKNIKLEIKNIGTEFQKDFEAFSKKHNYAKNTVAMDLKFIKNRCIDMAGEGAEVSKSLKKIQIKSEKVLFVYLDFDEIDLIKKATLPDYLDNARDWLVISCYTAQRVSDFMRFTTDMLRTERGKGGKKITLIDIMQVKGEKPVSLPLHKEVLNIIEKRGGFPHAISDVKYNVYIKKVCKKAGLTDLVLGSKKVEVGKYKNGKKKFRQVVGMYPKHELVSSHIGRRSFATNYYGKIPTSLLIAATGHSTEQMFLKYIGKSSSDRAMELADWF